VRIIREFKFKLVLGVSWEECFCEEKILCVILRACNPVRFYSLRVEVRCQETTSEDGES
jgi:hypothetical protein